MRIVNWNIERHGPDSWQARSLLDEIARLDPDLLCLTEAWESSAAPLGGFAVSAAGAAWSSEHALERKVLLWSRSEWRDVQPVDALEATGSAITGLTLLGSTEVRIVGLCIPYHFANPFGQEPRAKPWSQHERFLEELAPLLRQWRQEGPVMVLGDFNQFIPRVWGPKRSYELMEAAFESYDIVTGGETKGIKACAIDHVAFAGDLIATDVVGRSAQTNDGRKRSDHFGVVVDFDFASA